MLHLLIDISTWLDLSRRRDGQRWIVALRLLVHQGELDLLVPGVIVDEFERNRERVETSMTATVAQRFKLMKQDLGDYGGTDYEVTTSHCRTATNDNLTPTSPTCSQCMDRTTAWMLTA